MTPNKIPLFLRELLTRHLFVFGGGWGAEEGGVIDRESAAPPTAASSAEEASFLLLLQPGEGWRFSPSSCHCVFPVPQASQWGLPVLNLVSGNVSP